MTNREILLMGDIKQGGFFHISEDITIKSIIMKYGEGLDHSSKIKLVQIGGPLGVCITSSELNSNIKDFDDQQLDNVIMVMGQRTCVVDFALFSIQHVKRELNQLDDVIKELWNRINKIVDGKANLADLKVITNLCKRESKTFIEGQLKKLLTFLIDNFKEEFYEHIENQYCATGFCRKLIDAKCINACPARVYIPGYVALIKDGNEIDAYRLMRKKNPFSFVCGKICSRPCEANCKRGELEKTVGVRALKRYASEMALKVEVYQENKMESNGKKVGIVGAGPSGLSAAYYLTKSGYEVTIFEAANTIGGMLSSGIPTYRLPQTTIDKEVKILKDMGCKILVNTKVGKDILLKEIRRDFDAVLLATGCHIANRFGPNIKSIETAIDLLKDVKVHGRTRIGERVLIIGGGDVAIDTARTAVRLGANKAYLACLESYEMMPASEEEKVAAEEEKIEFINGFGYKAFNIHGNELKGITLKRCIRVFDDEYNFSPRYREEDCIYVNVDHIILAIGQKPEINYLDEDIHTNARGFIKVDKTTFKTSADRVYAVGDMWKPGIAIKAIAEGRKAAIAIDSDLDGSGLFEGEQIIIPEKQLYHGLWDVGKKEEHELAVKKRSRGFDEVSSSFTAHEAYCEAERCLRCDRNSRR
ncbi:FAD-dependent oxidoreductase [Vallitalea okinawensis]|uniref:FAD-dependent oxidoreductase n=1 Tax=Vallitalea okinawensis TaxID=2078660 RepID=UPI000CFDF578|nr:FAD-dependent oxidoreductase [Vallitalea okinawensis]